MDEAAQARRMRADGLSAAQIQRQLGVTKVRLMEWLREVPAPGRSRLRQERYEAALALRRDGWSVNDIALELGIAKSTAWLWVKHLPLDTDSERAARKRAHSKLMTDAQWAERRRVRDVRRAEVSAEAGTAVGRLTDRDLLLIGSVMYWCEGTKAKPWRPNECRVTFTNSDPTLVMLFIRFLESCGVDRQALRYRVSIHESADVAAAQRWWAEHIGVPAERFHRPTRKRHPVRTVRHNTGQDYRGCVVVSVPRGRQLYWRIEGVVRAITDAGVGDGTV